MAASEGPKTERHRADPDPDASPASPHTDEQGEPEVLATHLLRAENPEVPRESQDDVEDWLNRVDPVARNGTDVTSSG